MLLQKVEVERDTCWRQSVKDCEETDMAGESSHYWWRRQGDILGKMDEQSCTGDFHYNKVL